MGQLWFKQVAPGHPGGVRGRVRTRWSGPRARALHRWALNMHKALSASGHILVAQIQ